MSDSDEETPDLREPDDSDDEAPYDPINEHDLKILEGLHDQETTSPLAGSLLGSYCLDCDDGEFVELFEKLHVDSGGLLDALQGRVGTVEDDTSVWCIVVVVVAVGATYGWAGSAWASMCVHVCVNVHVDIGVGVGVDVGVGVTLWS